MESDADPRMRTRLTGGFLIIAVSAVALGAAAWVSGAASAANWIWAADTVAGFAIAGAWTIRGALKRQAAADIVAVLALLGCLLIGEMLAGAVITVMLATGQLLEARSHQRAARELSLLLERSPRMAKRLTAQGLESVAAGQIRPRDVLLVGAGEVVPVDGRIRQSAVVDQSTLTGEAEPVELETGADLRSGTINAADAFEMFATRSAADSTYEGLVRLVENAQRSTAPLVRQADRIAWWFIPLTVIIAGAAWILAGDPARAVAVLVVATPCPLLLATPIAILSGISQAASNGVIVKSGAVLEQLARIRVILFDKTGTLTEGHPQVVEVVTRNADVDAAELLSLAGALDQLSAHLLATSIVSAAAKGGAKLSTPTDVEEIHGTGISGTVDSRRIQLGKAGWLCGPDDHAWTQAVRAKAQREGRLTVFVAVDGHLSGVLLLADRVRPDAARILRELRVSGIEKCILATGDRMEAAQEVGLQVGIDRIEAECTPAQKVSVIEEMKLVGPTMMVGDGINDAPALAAADIGVALAARGASASSQAADVVLTVENLDALALSMRIARRAHRIAFAAGTIGMSLAAVAMAFAAAGLLAPVAGAFLQEGIDVLAILIALTVLLPSKQVRARHVDSKTHAVLVGLRSEHAMLESVQGQLVAAADELSRDSHDLGPVHAVLERLEKDVLPHETTEERQFAQLVAPQVGGVDPLAALSRGHAEIAVQIHRLRALLTSLDPAHMSHADRAELRKQLYGLHAIIALHNQQEEEIVFSWSTR